MISSDYSYLVPKFFNRNKLWCIPNEIKGLDNFSELLNNARLLASLYNRKLVKYMIDSYIQFKSGTVVYIKKPRNGR